MPETKYQPLKLWRKPQTYSGNTWPSDLAAAPPMFPPNATYFWLCLRGSVPWEVSLTKTLSRPTVWPPASELSSQPSKTFLGFLPASQTSLLGGLSLLLKCQGFLDGSDGRESARNAGDSGWSLGREDPLEKGTATYPCILAWKVPWTEEPSMLQSMGVIEYH